jgi:hypothetical protein
VSDRPRAIATLPAPPAAIAPMHQPACMPFISGRPYARSTVEPCAFIAMSNRPNVMPNTADAPSSTGRFGARATPTRDRAVSGPPIRSTARLPTLVITRRIDCIVTSAPRPQASRTAPTSASDRPSLSVSAGMRTVMVPTMRPASAKVRTAPYLAILRSRVIATYLTQVLFQAGIGPGAL